MKKYLYAKRGTIFPPALIASAIVGLLTLSGLWLLPPLQERNSMTLASPESTITEGTTFTVDVIVNTTSPVNAFAGAVQFDPAIISVAKIDYNTSIADLWAEEPWYNNGDGTISFAGGSTRRGGFSGSGSLISITFAAQTPGTADVQLSDIHILQHDGLGTELEVVSPVDAFFSVIRAQEPATNKPVSRTVSIITPGMITDLNNDGVTSLGDISIFMVYLTTNDLQGDVNRDGAVTLADLSMLLEARNVR